jgi:hypothetical protein
MEPRSLVGKTLRVVWIFRSGPVHAAWVDKWTTPIVAGAAFLETQEFGLLEVDACEVNVFEDRYPSLGLELRECTEEAMYVSYSDGRILNAEHLIEVHKRLPATITDVEVSDPLGEGAISQYVLILGESWRLIFRHIMPPTTLGICITE